MAQFTPENARQMGRLGGLTNWSRNYEANRRQVLAMVRKREAQFPNESARRLHYTRLSALGVAARQAKRAAQEE